MFQEQGRFSSLILPRGEGFGPFGEIELQQVESDNGWFTKGISKRLLFAGGIACGGFARLALGDAIAIVGRGGPHEFLKPCDLRRFGIGHVARLTGVVR